METKNTEILCNNSTCKIRMKCEKYLTLLRLAGRENLTDKKILKFDEKDCTQELKKKRK